MCESKFSHHHILGKRLDRSQGKRPQNKIGITTTVIKCSNCQLIFSNPQPIPFDLQDHYGIPAEDYWSKDYFNADKDYFSDGIYTAKKLLNFQKGFRSLDIGAGIGKCMIALENSGFDSYGLEPSQSFYKKGIEEMKLNPDKIQLGTIESIDYPDCHFDFITFGAVLEHLYDPNQAIIKSLKWLKPNGIIHIEVPSSNWLISKIVNVYYKLTGVDYVCNLSPMHPPFHLYEFGLNSFIENSKNNGYQIVHHQYFVCQTYMPKIMDFFIKPLMKMTKTGMQIEIWLRKN